MQNYKWSESAIGQEFRSHGVAPNFNKVRKFQRFTDDMSQCVEYCVISMQNDKEALDRMVDHGTGAI